MQIVSLFVCLFGWLVGFFCSLVNSNPSDVSQELFDDHGVVPSRVNGRLRNKSRKDYSKDIASPQKQWLDGAKRKLYD
jgi:hypothetical protein